MSEKTKIEQLLFQNHITELYQTFVDQRMAQGVDARLEEFDATVSTFAENLIQPNQDKEFLQALRDGTARRVDVTFRYRKILHGITETSGAITPAPGREKVLRTSFGNVLIVPHDLGDVSQVRDTLAKLSTTPMAEGGLPRLAQFTEGYRTIEIGDLTVMTTPFDCRIIAGGGTLVGEANLLEHYATAVRTIKDRKAYLDTWNLFIADFLHRAETVRKSMESMFKREKQRLLLSGDTSEKPVVMNLTFFQRLLIPLTEVAEIANKAFVSGHRDRTVEYEHIAVQTAKINNAMMLAFSVANKNVAESPITHEDIASIVSNAGLGVFSDMFDHLDKTYHFDPTIGKYLEIELATGAPKRFRSPQSIPAIRLLIDTIIYQGMLANYGKESSKVSFKFDEPQRRINVSYEKPQPLKLIDELNRISTKWNFRGELTFAKEKTGVNGVTIVDTSPDDPSGKLIVGSSENSANSVSNGVFAGGGELIAGFPYFGMGICVASNSALIYI